MSRRPSLSEQLDEYERTCEVADAMRTASREERTAMEEAIPAIIKDVCELDGYTSPPDNPDLLQCTVKELTLILRRHILGEE